ncbi:LytR/AlgR family response regulator transcription factor [Pedobacter fastidiosus]|uniref:Response regulator transcription factor n=1 Tax=Pedobacter fastidiosus TaxID=2765361 RepID=A0ABR7KP34_9SPHI|nr:LytTR family DNA-binding domain-containing protein [Pedobacter fastidiosus]MBC6109522.1 response regulator transcription factor [Pedobacter fastidiosus]
MGVTLSCIIVDDSDLDRKAVENEVFNYPDLKVIGSFDNCLEAMNCFTLNKPDILFVDIDMPEINGLEFIKAINNTSTANIIISSHPEYALEGFQLKVFDFILKPLETQRFDDTIKRLKDFNALKNKAEAYDVLFENEEVVFKDGLTTIKLKASDILYLEAFGDYTKIVTEKKIHLTLTTLSKFIDSLPTDKFVRIHRSYAVAQDKIKSKSSVFVGVGDVSLPIGKTYKSTLSKVKI